MIDKKPDVIMEKGDIIYLHLYDRAGEKHEEFILNGVPAWNAFERRFELSAMSRDEWYRRHPFSVGENQTSAIPEQGVDTTRKIAKERVAEYRMQQILSSIEQLGKALQQRDRETAFLSREIAGLHTRIDNLSKRK